MIKGTFRLAGDIQEVIVDGNNLMFYDSSGTITTIEGLRLSQSGVFKEFPDLIGDEDWRKKSMERLKKHMKEMNNEKEKMNYVKEELVKFGYTPLFLQVAGFRQTKFKENN